MSASVLATLAGGRLVTVSEGSVEVAHEALLREWPRLREWIEEDTEGRRLRRHITQAATEWDRAGRDPAELYRGARLAAAARLDHRRRVRAERARARVRRQQPRRLPARGHAGAPHQPAAARPARRGRRAPGRRRRRRDLRRDPAQRGTSTSETAQLAQRLGAQALAEDDLDLSLLLARQAVAIEDTPQTRSYLLAALARAPGGARDHAWRR